MSTESPFASLLQNAAGDDPRTSVVDRNLRTHDHPNLYLVGSSTFPTITASPPTLTIAAFALRAALTIRTELTS